MTEPQNPHQGNYRTSSSTAVETSCSSSLDVMLIQTTGCTGINPRVNLLEYLVSANLNILNKGNKPTFVVSNRQEVIDLTLGTEK
jgi:hypothetical protein